MKTILWVSRHKPLKTQLSELRRLFGEDCKVVVDQRQFTSADSIIKRVKEHKADELVLVAPLSVCKIITERGLKPLWAEMKRTQRGRAEIKGNGMKEQISGEDTFYRFIRFKRLNAIHIELTDVKKEI